MDRRKTGMRWLGWEIFEHPPEIIDEYSEADNMAYAKAITVCAAGDGEISQHERDWIIGYLTSAGSPEEVIEAMRTYEGGDSIEDLVNSSPGMKFTGRGLIYDALRACASDGELSSDERARVVSAASRLGIETDVVDAIEAIVNEETALRKRRHKLMVADVFASA